MNSSLKAFSKVIFLPDFLPQKKKAKKGRRDFFPIVGQRIQMDCYMWIWIIILK